MGIDKILKRVEAELEAAGIDMKVHFSPGLWESVEEMGKYARDQVVMVRIDQDTRDILDAWVETGAVKSRSEAAALFIREGLKVREEELSGLKDALREVDEARERLRNKAKTIFGSESE